MSKHYTCRQNITQTKTNKQLYIYSPLGQTFWISYREKVEHLQNSSEYCMSIGVKYSLYSSAFVQKVSFEYGGLENIFLNFSEYRVVTHTRVPRPMHVQVTPHEGNLTFRIDFRRFPSARLFQYFKLYFRPKLSRKI
jgi:hypothetical protein